MKEKDTVSNDKSNNNRLRLSVSQNDNTPLKLIQQRWGSIRVIKKKSCMSDKICVGNEWRVSHKKALEIITEIEPYMLIPYKINQIEKVLENAKKDMLVLILVIFVVLCIKIQWPEKT